MSREITFEPADELLDRLRVLTETVSGPPPGETPPLFFLIAGGEEKVFYNEDRTVFGVGLFNSPECAIQKVFQKKGSTFVPHSHDFSMEVVLVLRGRILATVGDLTKEFGPGSIIHIPSDVRHYGSTLEDTWMIAVTVPADQGYPNAPGIE